MSTLNNFLSALRTALVAWLSARSAGGHAVRRPAQLARAAPLIHARERWRRGEVLVAGARRQRHRRLRRGRQPALAAGVAINPGAEWSVNKAYGRNRMRLGFASPTHEEIHQGVAALAEICRKEFGVPK